MELNAFFVRKVCERFFWITNNDICKQINLALHLCSFQTLFGLNGSIHDATKSIILQSLKKIIFFCVLLVNKMRWWFIVKYPFVWTETIKIIVLKTKIYLPLTKYYEWEWNVSSRCLCDAHKINIFRKTIIIHLVWSLAKEPHVNITITTTTQESTISTIYWRIYYLRRASAWDSC